jgi:hypothetical protein
MQRRIVGGESPNRTRRCVLGREADRHPAQARAPYPASTVLIMLGDARDEFAAEFVRVQGLWEFLDPSPSPNNVIIVLST